MYFIVVLACAAVFVMSGLCALLATPRGGVPDYFPEEDRDAGR